MTSSFHVRIRILSKEVGYLFWVWINSPEDTDVLKRTLGRLKKFMTSYDQTRRRIYEVLKTPDLRRFLDVWFMTLWRRLIYVVWNTSNLGRLENIRFTTSSRRWIYDVKTSDLRRLEDVQFTTSWRLLICDSWRRLWNDVCVATSQRRLCNVERNDFFLFCTVWNIQKILRFAVEVSI